MAPSRKEQYEKNAWSWVDNCHLSKISDEHVRTAYRLNLSRCKIGACRRNCKGNPFCLSSLGEHRWLGSHEDTVSDNFYDPEKERRKHGSYVGLKNLGATCYVNSLLQLWFHNLNFRKAIFMWDPQQDPEEKQNITITEEKYVPLSVLGHLQTVFALMKYGERRFVDPTDFILSLRLDTSIQQDAQEFSKLFLSKVESTLSFQSAKEVRDLIKDNFCGEYSYVTRCMKCEMESKRPSTFYELDLNIKGHKTIQDCLREFMNVEMLEGDDKYFCQVCAEKQDAQRFISLTELPPVLNLQLMRFVFDKNTGYKKKLNTFVQFPDKLNMREFCPNVEGNLDYCLSAVLVHGGRSANSGHYVAHICDSESGTWYKFNDESVEKIEGKKLKLGTEDEYEDGGKKMKIPRAPKGCYHSPNAYMLVYTRSDGATTTKEETPLSNDASAGDAESSLPLHLRNFVRDQNLQFENWVTDVKKNNDMTVGRNHHQQLEMATNITLLSVETDYNNLEAVPTSWLTRWLSDPDLESAIDNEKHACCHYKLDPNEVSNVKYINTEMADKLFEKHGGETRFKYNDFLCRDCVIAKCLKIRVKNKTQEEFKIITNKMKSKSSGGSEMGYWVGKVSLRSWRRMALENLENGVLDRHRIESLLNDTTTDVKYGKGTEAIVDEAAAVVGSCKSEGSEKMNYENVDKFHCTNGRTDHENIVAADAAIDARNEQAEPKPTAMATTCDKPEQRQRRLAQRSLVISKLEECYSLSVANRDDPLLGELCEFLKNILNRARHVSDESIQMLASNCGDGGGGDDDDDGGDTKLARDSAAAATTTTAPNATSYNREYYNFLQNRDKTLQMDTTEVGKGDRTANGSVDGNVENGRNNHSSVRDADSGDGDDNNKNEKNNNDNGSRVNNNDDDYGVIGGDEGDDEFQGEHDDGVNETDGGRRRRRRCRKFFHRQLVDQRATDHVHNGNHCGHQDERAGDNIDDDEKNTIELAAATVQSGAVAAAVATVATGNHVDELQLRLNGDSAMSTMSIGRDTRPKRVADNEDDSSNNSETKFNDDLLCFHGNLCVEENNRKLVPEQVWRLLRRYFPYAKEFTSLSQPCGLCKSIASEAEVAKDMYKTEAVSQKESLSDLYLDRNRPQLDHRRSVEADVGIENVFYIINKEFINSWRKFIRENGKKEPPYSIKNHSWLLCADHSGFLYDLNQRIPNAIVVITRKEWQLLCSAYNADCEIIVKLLPDGTVRTSPDVCVPCMQRRIESEEKAQLCYSKAKIYIKVQNDEEAEYLSNEESRPPLKRAKISTCNNSIGITNGHGHSLHCGTTKNDAIGEVGSADVDKRVNGGGTTSETSEGGVFAADSKSHRNNNVNDSRQSSVTVATATDHHSSLTTDTSSSALCRSGGEAFDGGACDAVTAVRRSSRCRRVRGVKEIVVSSDLTLLDVKKKICEMMSVAPMDQHLFTSDGRCLTENSATLTELSIYPETVLNLKVDEPCEGVIADEFVVDREPEAGFKGTGLVSS